MHPEKAVITKCKIRSNSVVFYPSYELFYLVRGMNEKSRENLQDNKVKGYLSKNSQRKIRDLVENWINAVKAEKLRSGKSWDHYLSFVTLTLPAEQSHSDLEIKRECLNKFLIYSFRKWKVKNWIWKAEPQKNGNIHFHLIFDRFVPWQDVRKVWIDILRPLGYVQRFREKHGHEDPNCTDIHGLYRDKKGGEILFLGAYLSKYMSKSKPEGEEKDRPVSGRLWGCSDRLKQLKCFSDYSDSEIDLFYKSLSESQALSCFSGDFFRVFSGNWFEVAEKNRGLMRKIDKFYHSQFLELNKD